jgi:hypothetical protein
VATRLRVVIWLVLVASVGVGVVWFYDREKFYEGAVLCGMAAMSAWFVLSDWFIDRDFEKDWRQTLLKETIWPS